MSRLTQDEREALRQAALAAVPILAKLREEKSDLEARIARFQSIVDAHEESLGRRPKPAAPASGENLMELMRRGQVTEHIDNILAGGSDYKEPELRAAIWQKFGVKYSRATTYTALRRGEGKKYEQKEKRWRLKSSEVAEARP